jgi:hypothetical protein
MAIIFWLEERFDKTTYSLVKASITNLGAAALNHRYQLLRVILILAIIFIGAIEGETQIGSHQSAGQFLIEAIKISEPLNFCDEPVPLNEADIKERLERELLLALDNSDDVILWLKLANRYFPYIEKVLKNKSLPDDLKYIVVAESSLRPHAASNKGAVGFWQFIETTGHKYGMKINNDKLQKSHCAFI